MPEPALAAPPPDAGSAAALAPTPARPAFIWMNGALVPWERATVHVMTHALHYGSSVFEGIRCYDTPSGPALFRASDHLRRLAFSASVYHMALPYDQATLLRACKATVRDNGLRDAYLRPLAWRGCGSLALLPLSHPVHLMIAAVEWGTYLGEEALEGGVDAGISSWARPAANTLPAMAKAGGNYLSSQLIAIEAHRHGYAEGIALDVHGQVSEGSGENLFLVRDGAIVTPPAASQLLPGITRDTVITLARESGYTVLEERLPREALYAAEEMFFTGTAAEVTPVRSVDGIPVGSGRRGPVTAFLQRAFFDAAHGRRADHEAWCEHVAG